MQYNCQIVIRIHLYQGNTSPLPTRTDSDKGVISPTP